MRNGNQMDFFDIDDQTLNDLEPDDRCIRLERLKESNLIFTFFIPAQKTNRLNRSVFSSKPVWINTNWFHC